MTGLSSPTSGGWREWGARAWGLALYTHYFDGYDARPVSRLAISQDELAKAAGTSQAEATAARDAFVRAVRCSPTEFRRHLSIASLDSAAWDRAEPPSFLSYLFFTCFAAASLEADIADEGVFRERVRQLLGHPVGTSYALGDLSILWEAFAAWLQSRRNDGKPCRILILPDRGRMNLIGYSVKLAFPLRQDRLRLREVLGSAALGPIPTVPEAFQAVGRSREKFSAEFRHVFDRARTALVNGRDTPELEGMWSAILESAALASGPSRRPERGRYQLLAQEGDLGYLDLFVVAEGFRQAGRDDVRFVRLEEPFEDFDQLLCFADDAIGPVAKLLLKGALQEKAPGFSASPIHRVVREGVLLFERADSAIWKLAVTRPTEGRVRALVRTSLCPEFLCLLTREHRQANETKFDGWQEIVDFDITELEEPRTGNCSALTSVRCLQRVDVGSHLHLVGGIPVDGGYLGTRGLRPEVHCLGADEVGLLRLSEEKGQPPTTLVAKLKRDEDRPSHFVWSPDEQDLDGAHLLAGMSQGRVVAPRKITFNSRGLSHDYAAPTEPTRWLVEACATDVAPAGPVTDEFLTGDADWAFALDGASVEGIPVIPDHPVDNDIQHDRLVEALAAIAVSRKGIVEADLVEIVGRIVDGANGIVLWGILRGWVEAGYLDCLAKRNWRGRTYFARSPRFVLMSGRDRRHARVVLYGLAPYHLRTAVRNAFAASGAVSLSAASLSPFVPAPLSWQFESIEHALISAAAFPELPTSGVRESSDLAGDFDAVVPEGAVPPGYELQRVWDWSAGGFRRPNQSLDSTQVRINYLTRTNGPDRYVILSEGQQFVTVSRSWALLTGFRRAGRKAFDAAGSSFLLREGEDGPHLPLPIARSIALRSGIVSGPAETPTNRRYYAYATKQSSEQRWLLAWLNGEKVDGTVMRRFAWLREAVARHGSDVVPIPFDLRQRLRQLHSVPDAKSMADRRIPRFLLCHVRRAVELAGG